MKIWLNETIDWAIEFGKNMWAFFTGRTITFQEYIRRECKEIFGDDNRWYAGQNLQHPPTDIDCQNNYLQYEGDKLFRKKNRYLVERTWQKKIKELLSLVRYGLTYLLRQTNYKRWA